MVKQTVLEEALTPTTTVFQVMWTAIGGSAERVADPAFPMGREAVFVIAGARGLCRGVLPYPLPCSGVLLARCTLCGRQEKLITEGVADDPSSLLVSCTGEVGHA